MGQLMLKELLIKAFTDMYRSVCMANIYENNRKDCQYVHSTSLGHQAIQLATAYNLTSIDYVSPYYRDESILLGLGFTPEILMKQLLAKADDYFSGGRSYYSHPSSNLPDKPTIIHQSSATGMQLIPSTGIAKGIQYMQQIGKLNTTPIIICSLGDASITEGEASEAFQNAILYKLPIIYLVQNNNWGISVTAGEARVASAVEYAKGFPGLNTIEIDGTDFERSYYTMQEAINAVRNNEGPLLIQANVPLLGHHTSGVRKEFYRTAEELAEAEKDNPLFKLQWRLGEVGISESEISDIKISVETEIKQAFSNAINAAAPTADTALEHIFAPTPVTEEEGERAPKHKEKVLMVDAALFAIQEILEQYPEALLFGQDVGKRLGGVFREAATLGDKFGDHRVFNTAIQEAYIVGSTAGLCAVGAKPIVEVQFADYIWPALNQLVCELSKSCYLTNGKFPIQMILRVPTGAYGGGGPYHSGSIESTLLSIKGIKVVYPSNAADMKGLMKAAFHDPNPVVMLEHKGLYWSKVPGTEEAKTIEPDSNYILPLGKANIVEHADNTQVNKGNTCCVITYGMGVYWAKAAAKNFNQQVEIVDLRTLYPLDEKLIFNTVKKHNKCLVVTEDVALNSFAQALAGRISSECFQWLDAPVEVIGTATVPAIPIHLNLEAEVLPNANKVRAKIESLLNY